MSCTCLAYIFWIHLHTWDKCTVGQSQRCSILTALGLHEQPARITMRYWQNQLQDTRGAGGQCCCHSGLQGAALCQAHARLGLLLASVGPVVATSSWPWTSASPGLGLSGVLSKNHHRKYRHFLSNTEGKEEYWPWKHCETISEASLGKQTYTFLLSFLSALEGFLKASFGAGWCGRGRSDRRLCPAALLLLPRPGNSPFIPVLVH